PLEQHVARKEGLLRGEVEARRALGVPGRVHRDDVDIRDVAQGTFLDEIVGGGRRHWDLRRRTPRRIEPVLIETVDRQARSGGFLDRRVAGDVVRVPVRVQDLDDPQGPPDVLGKRWMVSSSHYLASQAGTKMFERGGNAIDAGVAAGIALNVLERHLTDFGGVAPIVLFRPGMAGPESIDGLGRWPA